MTLQISHTITAIVVSVIGDVPACVTQTGTQVASLTVAVLSAVPAPTLTAAAAALVGVLTGSIDATSQTGTTQRMGGPT